MRRFMRYPPERPTTPIIITRQAPVSYTHLDVYKRQVSGLSEEQFQAAARTIFSEPNMDSVYGEEYRLPLEYRAFATEYLPGQYLSLIHISFSFPFFCLDFQVIVMEGISVWSGRTRKWLRHRQVAGPLVPLARK